MTRVPAAFTITASDGYELSAHVYAPIGNPRAYALIVPAMGVPQRFYAAFSRWLAAQGIHATTFDYRGMGLSRHGPLRGFKADIMTWARVDVAAVLAHVTAQAGAAPIFWIGHSLGGQILPFVPGVERVTRMVTVASGSGHWRENAPGLRWRAPFIWYGIVPVVTAIAGYFPGKRLGALGDLPLGVISQWRRWCLNADYAAGAEGPAVRAEYAAVRTPIVSLSFTDDEYMSARNIESLHAFYTTAPREMKRFAPADVGERHIGHFNFFRERYRQSLWEPHLLPYLRSSDV